MRTPAIRRLDRTALWEYAVRLLAGRAHSTGELRRKLERRAGQPADVDDVLHQLKDYGYLDDRRFAESYAAARLDQKFGQARVVRDLRQRRIAPSVAEGTVQKVYRDVDETAMIEEWVRRKYRLAPRDSLFQEDKEIASAYRRLLHAGFHSANIIGVLKRFAKNPELLDSFEPPEEPLEEE